MVVVEVVEDVLYLYSVLGVAERSRSQGGAGLGRGGGGGHLNQG